MFEMIRRPLVLPLLIFLFSNSAFGDSLTTLQENDRLRLVVKGMRRVVSLEKVTDDGLLVWGREAEAAELISYAELERAEVGTPRTRRLGSARGATYGFAFGIVVMIGAGMASTAYQGSGEMSGLGKGFIVLIGGAAALSSIAIGAAIGAAYPGTEWDVVPLPPVSPSGSESSENPRVGVTLHF